MFDPRCAHSDPRSYAETGMALRVSCVAGAANTRGVHPSVHTRCRCRAACCSSSGGVGLASLRVRLAGSRPTRRILDGVVSTWADERQVVGGEARNGHPSSTHETRVRHGICPIAWPVFQGFGADRFRTAIARACRTAGVPTFSPHDLRHRRISLLHEQGVSWARIGEGVGQRNLAVTANTYTHVIANGEVDYAELVAAP